MTSSGPRGRWSTDTLPRHILTRLRQKFRRSATAAGAVRGFQQAPCRFGVQYAAVTALVAQRIEHLTTDQKVGGSSPSERAQLTGPLPIRQGPVFALWEPRWEPHGHLSRLPRHGPASAPPLC